MLKKVVIVSGKDPCEGHGGSSNYVRLHARAAIRAGYEPHVFCIAPEAKVVETDYGVIHVLRTRWRPFGPLALPQGSRDERFILNWFHASIFSPRSVPFHQGRIVDGISDFMRGEPGLRILHGFSTWGYVAGKVKERLGRRGRAVHSINSVYTTIAQETRAMAHGVDLRADPVKRLLYECEWQWVRHVVSRYERWGYRAADLVLANYDSVRKRFFRVHGPHPDFRLVPYAAEPAFRAEASLPSPPPPEVASLRDAAGPLIVSVSRHDPRKGLGTLLRALAEVRSAGVAFRAVLLGFGPLLARHRELATELGLDDVVRITGMVEETFPYLRQADIYVLPSLQEGSGSVALLEALQAGVAVVASDVDGIPEDVSNEVNGLLVQPGNVQALASALTRLIHDGELRRRLATAARRTHEERFTAERMIAALSGIYEEAARCAGTGTGARWMWKPVMRQVLGRELAAWSALTCQELRERVPGGLSYETGAGAGRVQVELEILEDEPEYVHVCVTVSDLSTPLAKQPVSSSFIVDERRRGEG